MAILFARAIGQGYLETPDPMAMPDWFAFGHYCATAEGIRDPPAVFIAILQKPDKFGKSWQEKSRQEDYDWADRQLKKRFSVKAERMVRRAVLQAVKEGPEARDRIASAVPLSDLFKTNNLPRDDQFAALANFETVNK